MSLRKKVLAISSGGGHFVELLRLSPAFRGHHVVYVTVSEAYREQVRGEAFRAINDATRWNRIGMVHTAAQILTILLRERPDVVVSTGALPGYFALLLGKTLLGAKTIWVDSLANADELSLSGREVRRHADLWLTQWPHLARDEGPHHRGSLLD